MAFIRKLARRIAGIPAASAGERRWQGRFTPDGGVVMMPAPRPGWPPHPLDVDIRRLPRKVLQVEAGGSSIEAFVAECPDGCGVVAWTDLMLPFNAPDTASAEAVIVRSYSR